MAESDNGITVILDTNLTPELVEEGFVRELTSKIQDMRKKAGFEVMDTINVYLSSNEKIAQILEVSEIPFLSGNETVILISPYLKQGNSFLFGSQNL